VFFISTQIHAESVMAAEVKEPFTHLLLTRANGGVDLCGKLFCFGALALLCTLAAAKLRLHDLLSPGGRRATDAEGSGEWGSQRAAFLSRTRRRGRERGAY
jgi:hypothetical protein